MTDYTSLHTVPEGYFRFNDIAFNVPPTDISVSHRGAINESSYLRSRHSSKTKTGRGIVAINMTMIVLPGELWKLHRLIQQFKYTPFWEIENNYIRSIMLPGASEAVPMAVCAEAMTITSIEENPDALSVQLMLSWFNYSPFSPLFSFKKHWRFRQKNGRELTILDIDDNGLDDISPPVNFPTPQSDEPTELVQRAKFIEFTDVTPPIVPSLPTLAVSADESNIYVLYLNHLQALAMERDFDGFGMVDAVRNSKPSTVPNRTRQRTDGSLVAVKNLSHFSSRYTPIPYAYGEYAPSRNIVFGYREYTSLSPNTALGKLLDKSFTKIRHSADTYSGAERIPGLDSSVYGTGTLNGNEKTYEGVGTAMVVTNNVGRVGDGVGPRGGTPSGGSRNHEGTDISWGGTTSGKTTSIHSPINGVIRYTTRGGKPSKSFGGWIVIKGTGDHEGLWVRLGHMANGSLPSNGDLVTVGQQVGNAGVTAADRGSGTSGVHGIHAHVELWENGCPRPPMGGEPRLMNIENVNPGLVAAAGNVVDRADAIVVEDVSPTKEFKYEPPTQEEMDAARLEAQQLQGEGWHLYNSPHVPLTLYRPRRIILSSGNNPKDGTVASVWGVELINRFASIPLVGHELPTAQYMGGQEARIFFQIIDLNSTFEAGEIKRLGLTKGQKHYFNDERLDSLSPQARQLFSMRSTLEYNARRFRNIPESWFAEVDFLGSDLAGSKTWVISSMGTSSIPGSPGLYQIQMEFDASAEFHNVVLENVTYDKEEVFRQFFKEVRKYITADGDFQRKPGLEVHRNGELIDMPESNQSGKWFAAYTNKYPDGESAYDLNMVNQIMLRLLLGCHVFSDKWYGGFDEAEIKREFDLWGFEALIVPMFGNKQTREHGRGTTLALTYPNHVAWVDSLANTSDFAQQDSTKGWHNDQLDALWGEYGNLTVNKYAIRGIQGPIGAYEARVSTGSEEVEKVRAELDAIAAQGVQQTHRAPRTNRGGQLGGARYVTTTVWTPEQSRLLFYTNTSPDLERAIYQVYKSGWAKTLQQIVADLVDRDSKMFPKTVALARKSAYAHMPDAYPDLILPAHPIMKSRVMTYPDFYFYNPSEDGGTDDLSSIPWKEQLKTCATNAWGSLRDFSSGKKLEEELPDSEVATVIKTNDGSDEGGQGDSTPRASVKRNKPADDLKEFMEAENDFVDGATGRMASKESGVWGGNKNTDHLYGSDAIAQLCIESANEMVSEGIFLMRRAFPTFKVEFVDDNGDEGWRSLSDFYGYSAVKKITCTRSRKIPADLVIIELQNVGGVLDGTMPAGLRDVDYIGRETKNGAATGRANEADNRLQADNSKQRFESVVLREGMDIRLRLGFANNPQYMENLFNGRVLQVSWDDNNDHVSIMAQAYTAELVAVEKGVTGKKMDGDQVMDNRTLSRAFGYVDTAELLDTMLKSPEILHFGRFKYGSTFQPGEAQQADFELEHGTRSGRPEIFGARKSRTTIHSKPHWGLWRIAGAIAVGAVGAVAIGTGAPLVVGAALALLGTEAIDALYTSDAEFKYKMRRRLNNPVDDNVFAPSVEDIVDWGITDTTGNIGANDILYFAMNTTVWDIFQEMTLRHPGWIASPVPYGRRMTMFFGVPSQRYWSRPIPESYKERMGTLRKGILRRLNEDLNEVENQSREGAESFHLLVGEYIEGLNARFKPFRKYHLASSSINLVGNNIAASSHGVWNAVSVTYTKSDKANNEGLFDLDESSRARIKQGKKNSGANWWNTLELKAHSAMPDEDVLAESIDFFNCNGKPLATRYGVGAIMRGLRDMYKGSITLIGNPRIKPYDIIMLADDYNGIAGPVEVEEVTHIFTPENGFISVITPDAVVIANEVASFPVLSGLSAGVVLNRQRLASMGKGKWYSDSMNQEDIVNFVGGIPRLFTGNIANEIENRPERAKVAIEAAASVFEPKVADTFLNMYNFWFWAKQQIAVNVVPLMRNGEPWVAGIPDDLFETGWDNFAGNAKSAIKNARKGRLATILSAQLHGYNVAVAYKGDMSIDDKWRFDKETSQ